MCEHGKKEGLRGMKTKQGNSCRSTHCEIKHLLNFEPAERMEMKMKERLSDRALNLVKLIQRPAQILRLATMRVRATFMTNRVALVK